MPKINGNEIRPGNVLEHDGGLWGAVKVDHVKPGKGGAFVRTRLKNVKTGRVIERTFKSGESVEGADVMDTEMQYLYTDGAGWSFMRPETFEQVRAAESAIASSRSGSTERACPVETPTTPLRMSRSMTKVVSRSARASTRTESITGSAAAGQVVERNESM